MSERIREGGTWRRCWFGIDLTVSETGTLDVSHKYLKWGSPLTPKPLSLSVFWRVNEPKNVHCFTEFDFACVQWWGSPWGGSGYLKPGTDSRLPLCSHSDTRGEKWGRTLPASSTQKQTRTRSLTVCFSQMCSSFIGNSLSFFFPFSKDTLHLKRMHWSCSYLHLIIPVGLRSWAKTQVWEFCPSCHWNWKGLQARTLHQAIVASTVDNRHIYLFFLILRACQHEGGASVWESASVCGAPVTSSNLCALTALPSKGAMVR